MNIAGFIPVGFSLCLVLTIVLLMKRYRVAVIITCFLLSLFVEISQSLLITRTSQKAYLILNSGGGDAGVVLNDMLLNMINCMGR